MDALTDQDKRFLETTVVDLDVYEQYSDVYNFRRGVELNRLSHRVDKGARPSPSLCRRIHQSSHGCTYNLRREGHLMATGSSRMSCFLIF